MLHSQWRIASRKASSLCLTNAQSIRNLLTLAVESSCDDSAVAVLEKNGAFAKLHFNAKVTANSGGYKGIHPLVALESHQENLPLLIERAIERLPKTEDGKSKAPDFISVTRGPGMRSNLTTGIDTAKGLGLAWKVPIVGVHHMQAHALTPRLCSALNDVSPWNSDGPTIKPKFPFLSLLVSGGHTMLIHSVGLTEHKILADSVDIAIGDMLDKAARIILPQHVLSTAVSPSYAALLERYAFPNSLQESDYSPPKTRGEEVESCYRPSPYGWSFPLPLTISEGGKKSKLAAFAFSGMNTYVQRLVSDGWDVFQNKLSKVPRSNPIPDEERRWLARETMRVAFEHLASRVVLVLENLCLQNGDHGLLKALVISGGVASNSFLRLIMRKFLAVRGFEDVEITAPAAQFCTDNAAMIAWAGLEMFEAGNKTEIGFRALRKWSLENVKAPEKEEDFKDVLTVLMERGRGP